MVRATAAVCLAAALLAACGETKPQTEAERQAHAEEQARACAPRRVTEAPDGTVLWRVSSGCERLNSWNDVYFSSSGTSTRVTQGKSTRPVEVPNVQ